MKFFRLSWYAGIAWAALLSVSYAQDLEPRRWAHVPVDSNFVGAAYARTVGNVLFDPVLKIEDATVNIDSILTTYLRPFDWSGKTARFDVSPIKKATREGLLDGSPAIAVREGFSDPRFRLSINSIGSPALKGKELQAYRASHTTNTVCGRRNSSFSSARTV